MKRQRKHKVRTAAVLAGFYLLGLLICVLAVGVYPIFFLQKPILRSSAARYAALYLEDPESARNQTIASDALRLYYDGEGRLKGRVEAVTAFPGTDPGNVVERSLPAVLSGREVFHLLMNYAENDLLMLCGLPIMDGEEVTGALFQVKNLKNLPEAVEGLAVCFTVLYWIASGVICAYAARKRRLEEVERAYIAAVTHSLKTPISSVRVLAEALCDGVVTDPVRQRFYYGQILQETIRQGKMVGEILDLARLQSGGFDFSKSAVCASEIFDPVVERYAAICDCTDRTLEVSEAIARIPAFFTNADCVRQVLGILLDNAVKFVPEGGTIRVGAELTEKSAVISIKDDGPGISKEDLPHIFERFFRCNRSDMVEGSGLGLAIAKEIIGGLKEKIWAESRAGEGAAFFFTLRLTKGGGV